MELAKAYTAEENEGKWIEFWEKGGYFRANPTSSKPAYCIVMPPPNVTGVLHMGHALVDTLQDVLIRFKRMSGFEVLWVPGTDHAGIATQTTVERHLIQTEGKRRSDYSREEFLQIVWRWKEKCETTILQQLKKLGCSCDFSRLRFTMDAGCNAAVRTLFKKLYEEGLIYQGDYLVNFDPVTQTALADDEVEYEEREGFLWTFRYPLADGSGSIRIATTRPETMLGDTAVCFHPKDERYQSLLHKRVRLPLSKREIPIIADPSIDPAFGTGMVKITPAHDPNDYKMGLNHQLEMINVMTTDGRINEKGGEFAGLPLAEAREAVVQKMKALGLLEKVERHPMRIALSYRSKAIIEPMLSKQWFIKMDAFAKKMGAAVESGGLKLLPQNWEHTYFHWIHHLRDWCISRQLWWGHRIPVWHHKQTGEKICYEGEGLPERVCKEKDMWEQDPDVLDTWFSSALWPFSSLGWPDKTADLQKFYPNATLITGHDILFFWVARMVMMGEYALGALPFKESFLHGLIYGRSYWRENKEGGITYVAGEERKQYDLGKPLPKDVHSKWEKLSKSKGNVLDPLDLIGEYGTDALRMTLCSIANQSPQIDLDRRRFEEFKNFANKLWNGARFVFMNLEGLTTAELFAPVKLTELEDLWIISSLNRLNKEVGQHLESYQFDKAAILSYEFFWNEFCAYYVEIAKADLTASKKQLLALILCNQIRLLHPMAPFITEELFSRLKERFVMLPERAADPYTTALLEALKAPCCAVAPYPKLYKEEDILPEVEAEFDELRKVVHGIRNIRGEMKIPPQMTTDIYLVGSFAHAKLVGALARCGRVEVVAKAPSFPYSGTAAVGDLTILLPLPAEFAEKEKQRLQKEEQKLAMSMEKMQALLQNPGFMSNAGEELVQSKKEELERMQKELLSLQERLRS